MEIIKLDINTIEYNDQLYNVRELKVKKELFEKFVSNPNNMAHIGVIDGTVIGLVWSYILERMDSGPMMFIYSVDVIKEYRRRGYAKKLVASFLDYANENGFRNSFLITDEDNVPANKLYQSLGGKLHPKKSLYMFFGDDKNE